MKKAKFVNRLQNLIPARWHMSAMCALTIVGGIAFSKLLLHFQFRSPMMRYGLSVAFGYGVFYLFIYWWLQWHFGGRRPQKGSSFDVVDAIDYADSADVVTDSLNVNSVEPRWIGGGGEFSGGGSSGSWGESAKVAKSGAESKSSLLDVADVDDHTGLVIVLGIATVVAIFGSTAYIVYQAPEILFEAAFEVLIAAGLFHKASKMKAEGWTTSIFKRTWIPFFVVLVVALAFGYYLESSCPQAISFAEYKTFCWGKE